ncbi:MAG: Lrp/AsnC family transcriptional regulator [Anaerolineae bacterium]|jgi:DNA-binding Lrp family transcriptional regulator|nr:Lrp/AsnC family transcriptional regulator [Anaerolineae bacterium]
MAHSIFKGEFDQLDRAILEELQVNGRISVADLGRKVHLSPPAVYQRIKRMERAGLIRGYHAQIDAQQAGYDVLCFIRLSLQPHNREQLDALHERIRRLPEVLECYHTAGSYDVLLKVQVPDHRALDALVKEQLMTVPGVDKLETSIALSTLKATTALKLF